MVRPTEWTLERYNLEIAPLFLKNKSVQVVARQLGMDRSNLYRIMQNLNINPPIKKERKESKAKLRTFRKDTIDMHL